MSNQLSLSGSIVALVTPLRADGSPDLAAWQRLLQLHLDSGTEGIVVAGTTGEGASLATSEYTELLDASVDLVAGRIPVIAGVGAPSTAKAAEQAATATDHRADALLCVTPYYLRTTQQGLYSHYCSISEHSDLPIVLYNVPSRTANDLLPETVARVFDDGRIVAIKEAVAGAERVHAIRRACADRITVLSGDDASCVEAMLAGARGVISVTANVAPKAMAQLCRALLSGDQEKAARLAGQLDPLHALLMAEPNPIPVKAMLHRLGWIEPVIRLPLVMPSAALAARIATFIEGQGGELLAQAEV